MNKKHSDSTSSSIISTDESEDTETVCNVTLSKQVRSDDAIRLLKLWREGDEGEQKETWEYLKKALDEDRLSNRRLFGQT